MVGGSGWSVLEWLTMTGWKLELSGEPGAVVGAASKDVVGERLDVVGEGQTIEELAWVLLEHAATALEDRARHSVAVAA